MPKVKIYNGNDWVEIGRNGKSAYELWLDAGNEGTQQEFLRSLQGRDGKDGKDGKTPTVGKDFLTKEDVEKMMQDLDDRIRPELASIYRKSGVASKSFSLNDLTGVDVASATNGQGITYNATTEKWEPTTLAGSGDMTAAVYDPNSVADDAFLMTNMNGGNWKVVYTNGSGDTIELALGANNTYLKSNGPTSAPSFATPTATVAALTDVGDVTITGTPADNEVVAYDTTSGEFINQTASEAGLAAASHTHTLSDVTDSGALAALDTVSSTEIDDEAVTLAKMAHVATGRFLGRTTAGTGDVEALTLTQARALLNVEDGADVTDTTNVTAAGALMDSEVTDLVGIKALDTSTLQVKPAEGAFVDGDKTKLDGIEASADVTDETNVVAALSGATLTGVTVTGTDKILIQDTSDLDNLKTIDPDDIIALYNPPSASTSASGDVELATNAETNTGTDATRAVTPDALAGSNYGIRVVGVQVVAAGTDTATGDSQAVFRIPSVMNGWNLVGVAACVDAAGTTGTTDITIYNDTQAADMLSTALTIDSGETDSSTAATAAVIDTSNDDVATGDKISINVDAVSTTAAQGLYVEMQFQLP